MSLNVFNPDYQLFIANQIRCRDLYAGEDVIKSKNETYLPATSGMRLDGMGTLQDGYADYTAYKMRALLPSFFEDSVNTRMGLLYSKPPVIQLPSSMEYLMENCDGKGMSLVSLLRLINLNQLIVGRFGLALDTSKHGFLNIITYEAETIINWSDSRTALDFVILDETGFVLDMNRNWQIVKSYRLMELDSNGAYVTQTETDGLIDAVSPEPISLLGTKLDEVPFVFINTKDIKPLPDKPPLSGLASLVLAIYRGEADYRQNLFMQGQDTLVTIGTITNALTATTVSDQPVRTGAGSRVAMEIGGDAKYIGVDSQGLAEQRLSLEADRLRAESKSGELVNSKSSGVESNEAMETRIASRTVTLNDIAITGAIGLKKILRIAAKWHGANPDEVEVIPNLDFTKGTLTGIELKAYAEANMIGAPISLKTIHDNMVRKDITTMSFEEEMAQRATESANG